MLRLRSFTVWRLLIRCIFTKDFNDQALFTFDIKNVGSMSRSTSWCRWTHLNRERCTGFSQVSPSFVHHFTPLYYPWVHSSSQYGRTAVSRGVRLEEGVMMRQVARAWPRHTLALWPASQRGDGQANTSQRDAEILTLSGVKYKKGTCTSMHYTWILAHSPLGQLARIQSRARRFGMSLRAREGKGKRFKFGLTQRLERTGRVLDNVV
jgi:hypothetical protein